MSNAMEPESNATPVVRLRGLPFSAAESDVEEFFKGLEIAPDGIAIQVNFQGRPTGQAFVRFKDAEQGEKALERNKQHMGSRYIEVFKGHVADMEGALRMLGRGAAGSLTTGAPAAAAAAPGTGPGIVGSAAGLGFLPFPGAVGMAVAGQQHGGSNTTLGAAAAAATSAGGGASTATATGSSSGRPASGSSDVRYRGVIRMRGMPYSATAADVTTFFNGMEIVPDGVFLCTHHDGRPTGEAYVEFVDEETASRSLQLHRESMGHRYVELFRSTKGEMMAAMQQRMFPPGSVAAAGAMGGYMGMGSVPGMLGFGMPSLGAANMAAMQQLALSTSAHSTAAVPATSLPSGSAPQPPSSSSSPASDVAAVENVCLKMRGLPFSATQSDILSFFSGFQVVPNGVHIMTAGPGERPTGEAFVEFASTEEAGRAMERHKQHMGSRYVELFRVTKSEALIAVQGGSLAAYNMASMFDPNMQLLMLQQQQLQAAAAAAGPFAMAGWQSNQGGGASDASYYGRGGAGGASNAGGSYGYDHTRQGR